MKPSNLVVQDSLHPMLQPEVMWTCASSTSGCAVLSNRAQPLLKPVGLLRSWLQKHLRGSTTSPQTYGLRASCCMSCCPESCPLKEVQVVIEKNHSPSKPVSPCVQTHLSCICWHAVQVCADSDGLFALLLLCTPKTVKCLHYKAILTCIAFCVVFTRARACSPSRCCLAAEV